MKKSRQHQNAETSDFGLSIGDLMAAIVAIFILLLCANLLKQKKIDLECIEFKNENKDLRDKLNDYERKSSDYFKIKQELSQALESEFEREFKNKLAEFDPSLLLIRFKQETTFDLDQAELKKEFQKALDSFFPKYLELISSDQFKNEIAEVKIEGHASKIGSYKYNMELSQKRTVSVLLYCKNVQWNKWIESRLTATGLSYSRPLEGTNPSDSKNQRVEFKIILDSESKLEDLTTEMN